MTQSKKRLQVERFRTLAEEAALVSVDAIYPPDSLARTRSTAHRTSCSRLFKKPENNNDERHPVLQQLNVTRT
jgi:hypothetical protein